jgi:uncharacterized Fe-S center protein
MADYTMGLMNSRWDNTVHVLHMVTVTERCDCLNTTQKPMLENDLGFLVGKNPFAIDLLASRLLGAELRRDGRDGAPPLLKAAETTAAYVHETYGVLPETPIKTASPRFSDQRKAS